MRLLQLVLPLIVVLSCSGADGPEETAAPPQESATHATAGTTTSAAAPAEPPSRSMMSDYALIPLDRLFGIADLIVAGRVLEVDERSITVHVDQTLAGQSPSQTLTIRPFVPSRFEGTTREVPYAAGQSFLWFLQRTKQPPGWAILGMGGEGELPIDGGFVHFSRPEVAGIATKPHEVHGRTRNIQRMEAPLFFNAVRDYRACFEWKVSEGTRARPMLRCDERTLDRYAGASATPLHRHLVSLWRTRNASE